MSRLIAGSPNVTGTLPPELPEFNPNLTGLLFGNTGINATSIPDSYAQLRMEELCVRVFLYIRTLILSESYPQTEH